MSPSLLATLMGAPVAMGMPAMAHPSPPASMECAFQIFEALAKIRRNGHQLIAEENAIYLECLGHMTTYLHGLIETEAKVKLEPKESEDEDEDEDDFDDKD